MKVLIVIGIIVMVFISLFVFSAFIISGEEYEIEEHKEMINDDEIKKGE